MTDPLEGLEASLSYKRFRVEVGKAELPGRRPRVILRVVIPNTVAVLPVLGGTQVVLLRQYRPAIGQWIIEAPAGTLEEGETPEEAAIRELREETGLRPGRLEKVGEAYLTPGYSTEYMHFYIVWDPLEGEPSPEEGEVIEAMKLDVGEALAMAERGEIRDAKTLLLLAKLREKLGL
ncbi:MAG: NUDIX hydrolase [Desulfurococcales archaeon]|nr:NUDIX hydrolase [Desulfurococcales archaeon]